MNQTHLTPNVPLKLDPNQKNSMQTNLISPILMDDSKYLSLPKAFSNTSISPSPAIDPKNNPSSNMDPQSCVLSKAKTDEYVKQNYSLSPNQISPQIKISPIITEDKCVKNDLTKASSSKDSPLKESTLIKTGLKNDYDYIKLIERNLYGELFLGCRKSDKAWANIQTIDKTSKIDLKQTRKAICERFIPYLLNEFPLVQKLYDLYEDSNMFYVCSEPLEYDSLLDNLIDDTLNENEVQTIVTSLLTIIGYASKNSGNINFLPNISLDKIKYKRDEQGISIKLGDNGVFLFEDLNIHVSKMIHQVVFYSPERAKTDLRTVNSELWAIGMLACVILIGKFPFLFTGVKKMMSFLKTYSFSDNDLNSSSWSLYSPLARQFVSECIKEQQGNISKLLNHQWLITKPRILNNDEPEIAKLIHKKFGMKAILKTHITIFTYIIYNLRLKAYINKLKSEFGAIDTNCDGKIFSSEAQKLLSQAHFFTEDVKMAFERVTSEKGKIFYSELIGRLIEVLLEELETQILKSMENISSFFNYDGIPSELYLQIMQGDFTNYSSEMPSLIFNLDISKKDHIYELEFIRALRSFCRVSAISLFPNKK